MQMEYKVISKVESTGLTSATIHAVQILYYLRLHRGELPTAMNISQEIGITYPLYNKIANKLKNAKLLCTVRGRNGG